MNSLLPQKMRFQRTSFFISFTSLFIGVLLLSSSSLFAQSTPSNWILMQSDNGLDIFYQEYTATGSTYLKFKFANSTLNVLDFDWNLIKDSNVLFQNMNQVIQANSEVSLDETVYVIPFSSSDILTSYIFEINPN